jgi:hypothetical protein
MFGKSELAWHSVSWKGRGREGARKGNVSPHGFVNVFEPHSEYKFFNQQRSLRLDDFRDDVVCAMAPFQISVALVGSVADETNGLYVEFQPRTHDDPMHLLDHRVSPPERNL